MRRTYTDTSSDRTRSRLSSFMTDEPCSDCEGRKLNRAVSGVTVGSTTLPGISSCSVLEALATVQYWRIGGLDDTWERLDRDPPPSDSIKAEKLDERSMFIATEIIKEIEARLRFLALVGLDYLTLDRRANTLSGASPRESDLPLKLGPGLLV